MYYITFFFVMKSFIFSNLNVVILLKCHIFSLALYSLYNRHNQVHVAYFS